LEHKHESRRNVSGGRRATSGIYLGVVLVVVEVELLLEVAFFVVFLAAVPFLWRRW
jgi:hypothetical protein